eukprot:CAMPEP_0183342856 /NCGR_PEP_ID=MMETSP0164_2-20130417/8887_1 /TAXON_ID=221442 /ORGANISM="Coccolithus pelagicus ssp braarudi, Strain PLY182g" /LENGTH=91 /DNA_ID=CAMNT_0025513557 /DNA_START=55 /DNA_END=326 /DNA_ORIENTATION=+
MGQGVSVCLQMGVTPPQPQAPPPISVDDIGQPIAEVPNAGEASFRGREVISFPGKICTTGPHGDHGTICVASFPGECKAEWDEIVACAEGG